MVLVSFCSGKKPKNNSWCRNICEKSKPINVHFTPIVFFISHLIKGEFSGYINNNKKKTIQSYNTHHTKCLVYSFCGCLFISSNHGIYQCNVKVTVVSHRENDVIFIPAVPGVNPGWMQPGGKVCECRGWGLHSRCHYLSSRYGEGSPTGKN